jgi:bacterioferritin
MAPTGPRSIATGFSPWHKHDLLAPRPTPDELRLGFISGPERLELRSSNANKPFPTLKSTKRDVIMDKAKLLDKLNEILKSEYAGLVQYTQFSFLVQDAWREVYYKFFRENGEEALKHAHLVGDKITALGGVPTVERGAVKQSTDLHEMLEYSLEVESLQVKLYTEALELCGEKDVALRVVLEDICREEQEGVDHLEKLLNKRELAISGHAQPSRQKVG